ncbi:hypothetical protein NOR_02279 [Metarhizium rileyi]|uniref:Uncharacterized protein n=1 Tax=Metarhizium rileyi (strain RCEF 4871) TaxID=1649241 RepID=A0A167HDI1_METRR|nr:hypothetical protein NOR_02279 [Metarhizium rileyi RCEF 4871]TWU76443.1 hypothetical protein ED733_007061 [Metarhizium rileyi]
MDQLQRTSSISRSPPSNHRIRTGDNEVIPMSEVSVQYRLEERDGPTPSYFHSYHRPMRRGTVLSNSPPDNQLTAATGLRGLHVNEADGTGVIAIGMALGSPTEERGFRGTGWRPQNVTTVTAAKADNTDDQQIKDGLSRSRSRKWGIFGRSRSKRGKNSDRAIFSPDQVISPDATSTRETPTSAALRGLQRTDFRDANPPPRTRTLGRSYTEPMASESKWSSRVGSPAAQIQTTDGAKRKPIPERVISAKKEPILDVEIPDVTLDRYSVMFASLLERRTATSLLARRQITQDKIRALREGGDSARPERETLRPGRRQSADQDLPPIPSLRLKPLQASQPYQPRSRNRSNTSPAVMDTPSKETFEDLSPNDAEKGKSPHIVRLASVKGSNPIVGSGITPQGDRPQLRSKFHIQSPMHQLSGSRPTIDSSIENAAKDIEEGGLSPPPANIYFHKTGSLPHLTKPNHTPPTSQQATRSTGYTTSTPGVHGSVSLSSLSGEEPEKDEDEDQDKAVQDAVEISIARQISMSREQRRMLGPLQMHPTEGRRIAETKSSTPRLVDPRFDPSSLSAGHRNSERVVLERV